MTSEFKITPYTSEHSYFLSVCVVLGKALLGIDLFILSPSPSLSDLAPSCCKQGFLELLDRICPPDNLQHPQIIPLVSIESINPPTSWEHWSHASVWWKTMWLNLFMLQGGWLPEWTHPTLTWIDPNGRTLEKWGPCPSTSTEKEKLKFYVTPCSFCLCNSACSLQSLDHAGLRKWGLTKLGRAAYLTHPCLALCNRPAPANPQTRLITPVHV